MRVCKDCEPMPAHYIEDFDFLKLGFWGGGVTGMMEFLCLGWVSRSLRYGSHKGLSP